MRGARAFAGTIACAAFAASLLAGCGDDRPVAPAVPPTPVKAIDAPPPEYPLEVACKGVGGKVELMITVGTGGTVTQADMQRSSGEAALDAAAMEAVMGWRFRPATYDGQPVETQVAVPVTFNVPPVEPEDCYYLQRGGVPPAAS